MARQLGEVCTFYTGTGFPIEYQGKTEGKYPFYKVGDISKCVLSGSHELGLCDNYIDDDDVRALHGTILPAGTIVFAKIGEAVKLNRRAITTCDCLVDNNVMGIKPNQDFLSLQYCYHFLCKTKMEDYAVSTTVPSVKKSVLEKIEIEILGIDEQNRICSEIGKTNELISLRKKQLQKLDDLVKSRFYELIGSPEQHLDKGETVQLDQIAERITVGFVGEASNEYADKGIPYLRTQNVRVNRIDFSGLIFVNEVFHRRNSKSIIHPGDIVISRVGANRGMAAVIPDSLPEANIANCLIVGRLKTIESYYLAYYLNESYGKRPQFGASVGSAQGVVNTSILKKWEIYVPNKKEQLAFVSLANQVEESKLTVQQGLDTLELLKQSFMQKYFG